MVWQFQTFRQGRGKMSRQHQKVATAGQERHAQTGDNRAWLMLGFLSVLWGGSFLFYKILVPVIPPFTLVLGRVGFSALCLHAVLAFRGTPLRLNRSAMLWMFVLGTLNCGLPFSLYAWSERVVSSGVAATLNATTPIFTLIALHCAYREERLTPRMAMGCLCAFFGVAVLIGKDLLSGFSGGQIVGELACLGSTISYAIGNVLARRLKGYQPLQLAAGQLTGAALFVLPGAVIFEGCSFLSPPDAVAWGAWLGIALLSTFLAYILYFGILNRHGAAYVSLVTFLVPVSALSMGVVFLGEKIEWNTLVGAFMIGCGLLVIDGRILRRIWKREEPTPA